MPIAEALAYAYCRSLGQCLLHKPMHLVTAKPQAYAYCRSLGLCLLKKPWHLLTVEALADAYCRSLGLCLLQKLKPPLVRKARKQFRERGIFFHMSFFYDQRRQHKNGFSFRVTTKLKTPEKTGAKKFRIPDSAAKNGGKK